MAALVDHVTLEIPLEGSSPSPGNANDREEGTGSNISIGNSTTPSRKWSPTMERHIRIIASKCAAYKWLHQISWTNHKRYHTFLGIAHIGLVLATGFMNILTASLPEGIGHLDIISAGVLFASLVASGAQQLGHYGEESEAHRNAALRYSSLWRNILRQLSSRNIPNDRAQEYFSWVSSEYDLVYNQSPSIPSWAILKFKATFKTHPFANEEEINPSLSAFEFPAQYPHYQQEPNIQSPNENEKNIEPDFQNSYTTPKSSDTLFRYELDRFMLNDYQFR